MAVITNSSTTTPFSGTVIHGNHGEFDSFTLGPGQTFRLALVPNSPIDLGPPDTGIGFYSFYHVNTPQSENPLFWNGNLRFRDDVYVNPDTALLTIAPTKLKQADLDAFKRQFPNDARLQAVTLDQLANHGKTRDYKGHNAQPSPNPRRARGIFSGCQMAVADVAIDVLLMIWGAIGIHGKINAAAVEDVAQAIEPKLSEIEEYAKVLSDGNTPTRQKATAIWNIGRLIKNGGMFEAVFHAIVSSLTWWDMVLYGVLGMAELAAAFLTDGAALVAIMVVEIATAGFVISDGAKVVQECHLLAP